MKKHSTLILSLCLILATTIMFTSLLSSCDVKDETDSNDPFAEELNHMVSLVCGEYFWYDFLPGFDYGDKQQFQFSVFKEDDMYYVNIDDCILDTLCFSIIENKLSFLGERDVETTAMTFIHKDSFTLSQKPPEYDAVGSDNFTEIWNGSNMDEVISTEYSNLQSEAVEARICFLSRYEWDYSSFSEYDNLMEYADSVFETYLLIPNADYGYTVCEGFAYIDSDGKMNYMQSSKWSASGYLDIMYGKICRMSYSFWEKLITIS